jgi:hypothetical protein
LEFKNLFYSSVAGAAVSAARLQSQLLLELLASVATGATFFQLLEPFFQLHLRLYQNLYQKVLQQLQL